MRKVALLLLPALLSLAFAPAPLPRPPKVDPDKEGPKKLQGVWVMASRTYEGRPVSHIVATVEIADGKLTYAKADGTWRSTWSFALDIKKSPRCFDMTIPGPRTAQAHGIYELKGDTLTLCYTRGPLDRPNDFDGSKPGRYFEVLKRLKR